MKLSILAGSTSQSVNVFCRDSTSTTGGGLAAVAPAGGSLLSGTKLYYSFSGANASAGVAVSLAVLAAVNSAWSSAGIVTLDGTNMVGWVRIDIPDAALAASKGRSVSFLLYGGTNMAPTPFEIELTGWDNQNGVRGGMTALPNAAAEASGGLPTLSAAQASNGTINANVHRWLTSTPDALASGKVPSDAKSINAVSTSSVTTVNANIGMTQPVNFSGTGSSAYVKSDLEQWIGTAPLALSSQQVQAIVPDTQKVDLNTIKTQAVTCAGGVTVPAATLASTTNITAGVITTVTTVTNQLTAAQIATGVWQDATAGDFTTASSIGKSLYTTGAVPGAAGGLFIAGSNAATTVAGLTTGALSCTTITASGAVAFQSTFAVTTSTALAALSCSTLTASGAVAFQSTWGVTGAVTFTAGLVSNITGTITTVTTATNVTTVNGLAAGVITATSIAASALNGKGDWLLSSGYTAPLDAAGVRTAVGLATNNLDTQLALRTGFKLASDGLDAVVIESGLNARQSLSIIAASTAGVLAGAATTSITVSAAGVAATNRMTATVTSDGNRTAVTLSPPA